MEQYFIRKTNYYKNGVGGIRAILIDKQKSIDFENGEIVEVNEEQLKTITGLKWGMEVEDANIN